MLKDILGADLTVAVPTAEKTNLLKDKSTMRITCPLVRYVLVSKRTAVLARILMKDLAAISREVLTAFCLDVP